MGNAKSVAFTKLQTLATARSKTGDGSAGRQFLEAAVTLRPEAVAVHYALCSMAHDLDADALAQTHCA